MKKTIIVHSIAQGKVLIQSDVSSANEAYETVGKALLQCKRNLPDELTVELVEGDVRDVVGVYDLGIRGSYEENGETFPSMYVTVSCDDMEDYLEHDASLYEERYLTCIHPESNNYKFYRFIPQGEYLQASYGRIGSSSNERFGVRNLNNPYRINLFWIRYYEKLSKGYIDQSDVYLAKEESTEKPGDNDNKAHAKSKAATVSRVLCERLRAVSRQYVTEKLVNGNVTKEQYKKSRELLEELRASTDSISKFDEILVKLMTVSPRRVSRVKDELVGSGYVTLSNALMREENLVNAMQAVCGDSDSSNEVTYFEDRGIKIHKATDKQVEEVKRHLNPNLQDKVINVWRVIDSKQKEKFDNYCKNRNIKAVKQFWHGSTTENWYSIIMNSLQLNPNAAITGKMFGYGIYFAPSAQKSVGYTSCSSSYWAHGRDTSGFLGLYAVAYGKPYNVTTACSRADERYINGMGYDSLHAHAGNHLRNDEVIVYNESACVLNYVVEIAA